MTTWTRRLFVKLTLLAAVPVAAACSPAHWYTDLGLDVWNLGELERIRIREKQREAELIRQDEAALRRLEAKGAVVQDLLAGRMTLFEAVAWFKDVNDTYPEVPGDHGTYFSADSEEENLCRQVLAWVEAEVNRLPPGRRTALTNRLRGELWAPFLGRQGTPVQPCN
jgi:hypothetical protein